LIASPIAIGRVQDGAADRDGLTRLGGGRVLGYWGPGIDE